MSLLTIQDLEDAMGGVTFDSAETAQATFLIDRVSSYLESATSCKFTPVTGKVARLKADGNGEIFLNYWYPVTDISNFHDFKTDLDITYPRWDGIERISRLYPHQVIDMTFNYGFTDVPDDIHNVAVDACRRGMNSVPSNLTLKTVGDVTYQYGDTFAFSAADQNVIDSYSADDVRSVLLEGHRGDPYDSDSLLGLMGFWANGPDLPPDSGIPGFWWW